MACGDEFYCSYPIMQIVAGQGPLVQRRHALFCKAAENRPTGQRCHHFYWAYTPMHVPSGSNGGLYGMLQLFSHSAPLFHYRTGCHSQPTFFPSTFIHLIASMQPNSIHTVCALVLPALLRGQASLQTLLRSWSDEEAQHTRHTLVTP